MVEVVDIKGLNFWSIITVYYINLMPAKSRMSEKKKKT